MKKSSLVILAVVIVAVFYVWGLYNSLVKANEGINGQWAQVETQYQRRFDLIPNLVNSVKGIMKQEQQVFTALADARTRYAGAKTVSDKVSAANNVETSLARLLVVVENYPDLHSSESVQTLMAQLEGTENRIAVERQRFNDLVRDYNVRIKKFPANVFAKIFGFGEKPYFQAEAGSNKAPGVNF